MMMKREELVVALRSLADAVEAWPDEIANRLRVEASWFKAASVDDLRSVCEVFTGKREILKLSSPEVGAVESSLGPIRAVMYYNRGILGDKVTVTEADLSLLDAPHPVEV
jgi:hypothetical protein